MQTDKVSFKRRLILFGAILFVFIAGFILYVYLLVSQTTEDNITNIESSRKISRILGEISEQLRQTERDIYELATLPDEQFKQSVENNLRQLVTLRDRLSALPYNQLSRDMQHDELHAEHYNQFRQLSNKLSIYLEQLEKPVNTFMADALDVNRRYPGMPLLLDELLPRNNQFLESVDLAIIETKQSPGNKKLKDRTLALFTDARYFWSQQANWLRLFVANRYGVFGESQKSMEHSLQNRSLYMGEVMRVLQELAKLDAKGKLGLQQSISLEEMQNVVREYDPYFNRAKDIYMSKDWRHDLYVLRQEVKPSFNRIWNVLDEFEEVLNTHDQRSIHQSQEAATTISAFVLLVGAIIYASFSIGYALFDRFIRKPLLEVSMALDAEARGVSSDIPILNYVDETDILIQAFNNMKEQVNTRQQRLESILNNAAEGIITTDEFGNIETFNIAAQKLFGYELSEVLGKNISMLVPEPYNAYHDSYIEQYHNHHDSKKMEELREVYAQASDGAVFPMSIKISEMILSGRTCYTAVVENISQRKAMIENLQHLAEHDSLTGLYNRHYFTEELDKFVARKKRGDANSSALLYIDMDNFKYINDTMGHLAGDQLIVEIALLLRNRTRDSDVLARLGGDEFAVLLYRPDNLHLEELAESFRRQFEEYTFKYNGKIIDVGCSIGAVMLDEDIESRDMLLARADFACHEAKRRGRNLVHVYRPEDDAHVSTISNDIGWTRRIKQALENDQFVLVQQPICSFENSNEDYYEILIRMLDEDGKLIAPSGFMSAAERFSLMTQIDQWVIKHAMQYMAVQSEAGNDIRLSINLSANSLEDEGVLQLIKDSIGQFAIKAENLIFEVTETIAMASIQQASSVMRQLQQIGCKTALDDFGIGYSSFAYLKDLPVDIVKIDGSFVRDIATDELHHAMVRSINDIAHAMGKQTVAEFVESEEAHELLAELNVDFAQGYYLGRPVIVDRCLLEKNKSSSEIKKQA